MPATTPSISADDIVLQLAEPRPTPFSAPGWYFELKFDGFRLLAERINGVVRLVLRRGRRADELFPEITSALKALPGPDFIIDGELVIQNEQGHPIFQRLLKRSTLAHQKDIDAGSKSDPAVFFGFDVLMLAGRDVRELSLRQRKQLLFELVPKGLSRILPVDHVEGHGEALFELVRQKSLEGVMAKKAEAPYRGGRGDSWLKIALTITADFAVVGYADDFGALYLATWNGTDFVFAGKVGAGFTPKIAATVTPELEANARRTPACIGDVKLEKEAVWVTPTLVIECRYKNWPEGLSLREPVFLRFRDDKTVHECPSPKNFPTGVPTLVASKRSTGSTKAISNPNKVYFPADGITKTVLLEYYRAVSRWLLPYLKDRPLMMVRYPDGIAGKNFFQKAKPEKAPDFIRTVRVHSEETNRDLDQIVCDDLQTLEWCAAMGAISLHIPFARVAALDRPDWCVVDFDPKDAPFANVMTLALGLRALCEAAGLPSFVKTSGSSGLHVLVPLGGQLDIAGAKQLGEFLSMLLVARYPDISTQERSMNKRKGRVYVDVVQNGHGKVVAAPFSVRAKPGAPVSMTLTWAEVTPSLTPTSFTLRDAIARLETVGDPMAEVLTAKPDIASAIAKLAAGA